MARRRSIQVAIEEILEAHGQLEAFKQAMSNNEKFFHVKFHQDGYQDLTIEKVSPDRVALANTFVQNGDVMWDPEIVFSYEPRYSECHWIPVEITQSPMGVYRRKFLQRNGRTLVDTGFHRAVSPLVSVWAKNLRWQGWDKAEGHWVIQ